MKALHFSNFLNNEDDSKQKTELLEAAFRRKQGGFPAEKKSRAHKVRLHRNGKKAVF